jgi:hypothetical protein
VAVDMVAFHPDLVKKIKFLILDYEAKNTNL